MVLNAEAFHHDVVGDFDWQKHVRDHSLGWVCARAAGELLRRLWLRPDKRRHAAAQLPVTRTEWHSVLSDWLQHGRFLNSHSCAAAVVARSRVTSLIRTAVHG
jgi:hypothetical protein